VRYGPESAWTGLPVLVMQLEPKSVAPRIAAKLIGCGPCTVRRLIKDKRLRAKRLYGRLVVCVEDIEAFLRSDEAEAGKALGTGHLALGEGNDVGGAR
jgi:excisionase family DNA binding protein